MTSLDPPARTQIVSGIDLCLVLAHLPDSSTKQSLLNLAAGLRRMQARCWGCQTRRMHAPSTTIFASFIIQQLQSHSILRRPTPSGNGYLGACLHYPGLRLCWSFLHASSVNLPYHTKAGQKLVQKKWLKVHTLQAEQFLSEAFCHENLMNPFQSEAA